MEVDKEFKDFVIVLKRESKVKEIYFESETPVRLGSLWDMYTILCKYFKGRGIQTVLIYPKCKKNRDKIPVYITNQFLKCGDFDLVDWLNRRGLTLKVRNGIGVDI